MIDTSTYSLIETHQTAMCFDSTTNDSLHTFTHKLKPIFCCFAESQLNDLFDCNNCTQTSTHTHLCSFNWHFINLPFSTNSKTICLWNCAAVYCLRETDACVSYIYKSNRHASYNVIVSICAINFSRSLASKYRPVCGRQESKILAINASIHENWIHFLLRLSLLRRQAQLIQPNN